MRKDRSLLVALVLPCLAEAAIWQSPDWAAVATLGGSAGYDSNLSLSRDGEGSAFVTVEPSLVMKRINSSSQLEIEGALIGTELFSGPDHSQLDGRASVSYAYPYNSEQPPLYRAGVRLNRSTVAVASVGQRVTLRTYGANAEGRLYSTGKLVFDGAGAYDRVEYGSDDYNTNQRGSITFGAGYLWTSRTQFSLNAILAAGSSVPHQLGRDHVNSREEALTFEVNSQVASKLVGKVFAGIDWAHFRGDYRRNDVIPIAGGEVTWHVTPRGQITAGINLGVEFSPDGLTSEVERLSFEYQQVLYGNWRWSIRATPERVSYERNVRIRRDNVLTLGTGLSYTPNPRLILAVNLSERWQDSTVYEADLDRHFTVFSAAYKY